MSESMSSASEFAFAVESSASLSSMGAFMRRCWVAPAGVASSEMSSSSGPVTWTGGLSSSPRASSSALSDVAYSKSRMLKEG